VTRLSVRFARLCVAAIVWSIGGFAPDAMAAEESATALVFARRGTDAVTAARIERDLRNMFDHAHTLKPTAPRAKSIEFRYDVGRLSKADLETARRHFNDAQRALEKGDADEAQEQLFRAERFYNKGIPYATDHGLLRGIFFYYYLARLAGGQEEPAREAYCAYVALTRNLAGSAGPIEQFEPLADKCGTTTIAGTAELRVTAEVDGAHVYVDDRPTGVVGRDVAFVDPFLPAGPHLVEVRKAGFARWGTLVNLKNGASESVRAKLTEAKNRKEEYEPLAEIVFTGPDASSEDYLTEVMFDAAERFGVRVLVAGYLEPGTAGQAQLTLITYRDSAIEQDVYPVPVGADAHRAVLEQFWQARFGQAVKPADAQPVVDRWAPTLFKVE
jgi:hypothetical protein